MARNRRKARFRSQNFDPYGKEGNFTRVMLSARLHFYVIEKDLLQLTYKKIKVTNVFLHDLDITYEIIKSLSMVKTQHIKRKS